MIYEEELESAFDKCQEVLGKAGKYEYPAMFVGVGVGTNEHGKLWYGDLTQEDYEYRIPALERVLGTDKINIYIPSNDPLAKRE